MFTPCVEKFWLVKQKFENVLANKGDIKGFKIYFFFFILSTKIITYHV